MPASHEIWGAWIHLAWLGLLSTLASLLWHTSVQSPRAAALALAANDRPTLLALTCVASSSSWARLLRAASRLVPADATLGSYGVLGMAQEASKELTAVFDAERARLSNAQLLGLVSAGAATVSGVRLASEPELAWIGLGVIGVALGLGVLLFLSARRASKALSSVLTAGPAALAGSPSTTRPRDTLSESHRDLFRPGCLAPLLAVPFIMVTAIVVGSSFAMVPVGEVSVMLFLPVLWLLLGMLAFHALAYKRVTVDRERNELVISSRILGLAWHQNRIPLEILRGFGTRRASARISLLRLLFVEIAPNGATVPIESGYDANELAAELNEVFGCELSTSFRPPSS